MDNLALDQSTPTAHATPTRSGSQVSQQDIMGQWEHDRFGVGASSISTVREDHQLGRSTVFDWQAFGQSHTSRPLPLLASRVRITGHPTEGSCRNENRRAGRNQGIELIGPTLPIRPNRNKVVELIGSTLPKHSGRNKGVELIGPILLPLPTVPQTPSDQLQAPGRTPHIPITPRSSAHDLFLPELIAQDQALRKRKSEQCLVQNDDSPTEEPQPKRASPDRPSPLSAAYHDGNNGSSGVIGTAKSFPHARKLSFERWKEVQTRPRLVAPNGTTIVPFRTNLGRKSTLKVQTSSTDPQVMPQHVPGLAPAVLSVHSCRPKTLSTGRPQHSSLPAKSTLSTGPNCNSTSIMTQPGQSGLPPKPTSSINPSTSVLIAPESRIPSPPRSRPPTDDSVIRRILSAGIGIRLPKRTEEETKMRLNDQEKRRTQREERERVNESMMRWRSVPHRKVEIKPTAKPVVKELTQSKSGPAREYELMEFNGKKIHW
ncbi:hypothetical protein WAI453_002634 [Rhynchosporium graminicola]|uniref:Uncharacterized protein n=1 Tax=Rhynchosporium graminicola TaxID=2792576 RepID=A0A1E1LTK4_9HELO|nr:uncharacterized protein RCO7_09014 [Rhynchosporium commune]